MDRHDMWFMDGVSGFWKRIDIRKENKIGILIKGKDLEIFELDQPEPGSCWNKSDYIFYADNSIYAEENEFPDEAKKEDETVGKTLGDVAKDIKKALGVEESDMSNEEDVVNHPSHYAGSCSIECFDVMRMLWSNEELANYCLINAFKYIWRHKNKNGLEDLRKAEWYMNKATEIMPVSYRWDVAIDLRRQLAHAFDEYDIEKEV